MNCNDNFVVHIELGFQNYHNMDSLQACNDTKCEYNFKKLYRNFALKK